MSNSALQADLPGGASAGDFILSAPEDGKCAAIQGWVQACNSNGKAQVLTAQEGGNSLMLLPRSEAEKIGFPPVAAAVLISSKGHGNAVSLFAQRYGLTKREQELVGYLTSCQDLRAAAAGMGLSYESVRTYLKRVYEKTGFKTQPELVGGVMQNPMALLRDPRQAPVPEAKIRNMFELPDGRRSEYFCLGPEEGAPVLVFDALSGVTIDVLGYPERCLEHLKQHNIRLIVPCRPGSYRSEMKEMNSLRDIVPDVEALLNHLGVDKAGILSISFGGGLALAVAADLPERISRVVMSSASFPSYRHPNWRELDQFYHMSAILGRLWPSMLRQIIPFLVRSILQNRDRYFDRYCNRTRSQDDIAILSHPVVRRRTAEMLAQRTAMGLEGMVEENLLNAQEWDFEVGGIRQPVEIFQGEVDNVAPIQGAALLAENLENGRIHRLADKGHYHHITNWPWLAARAAGRDVSIDSDRYSIPDL